MSGIPCHFFGTKTLNICSKTHLGYCSFDIHVNNGYCTVKFSYGHKQLFTLFKHPKQYQSCSHSNSLFETRSGCERRRKESKKIERDKKWLKKQMEKLMEEQRKNMKNLSFSLLRLIYSPFPDESAHTKMPLCFSVLPTLLLCCQALTILLEVRWNTWGI